MPIITETEARQATPLPVQGVMAPEGEPEPRNLLESAARVQNTVISAGQALGSSLERRQSRARRYALGVRDPGYNPIQDIAGYEAFATAFREDESPEEVAATKRRIDRELSDRRQLEAGGVAGVVAQIAAGVFDPVNLIPVGGAAVRSARLGETMVRSAARVGATGGAVATVAETALHATQETRTLEESAVSIGAATLLSGVVGAAVPLIRESFDSLAVRVSRDMTLPPAGRADVFEPGSVALTREDLPAPGEMGSAGAMAVARSQAKLKSALGVEKLIEFASPIMRTAQSPSVATRRLAQELAETPFYYSDNALGVSTPVAAETRIKLWQAPLAESLEDLDRTYVAHRQAGGDLSFKSFREEVGRAMRRNDTHPDPHVMQAAQTFRGKLFNPTKEAAIAVKLLPENVKVTGADSYLSRVYNVERITARRPEFTGRLVKWLRSEHAGVDDVELREVAEEITDHILSVPDGRVPYEAIPLKRGPVRERVINIPDSMIEDFLESDVELVSRFYARTIIPDIELARTFQDPTMRSAIATVADNYKDLIAAAKTEGERVTLAKHRDADIRDLAAMRDRLRGTYGAPADPSSFFVRGSRLARNWNYLSLMGAMVESSIPDLARPVMVHGVLRTLRDGVLPMVANFRKFRLAAEEAKAAGAALDMVLDSRAMELADIGDVYGRHSAFERGITALTDRFGKWALLTPWNAALKQFSSVITQHEILRAATRAGGMSAREVEKLAMTGIDAEMAGRIAAQFNAHGERGTVWVANTRAWTDRHAVEAFRAAVVKDVDRTVVTPGVGDRPLWQSSEVGKMIGQFKSFAFASTQRVLLAGMQQRDAATLNGALLSVTLGMGVYYLKAKASGRETSPDAAVWIREGVDRSGMLGWLYEVNNITEKFTRGAIGVNRLTGGEVSSRYASRGVFGALFGPSVGRVEDVAKATGAAVTGDFAESDVRAMRRLLPYQNLVYLRGLFDRLQEGAADALTD